MTHKNKKHKSKKIKNKKHIVKNKIFLIAVSLILLFMGFSAYNYFINIQKKQQISKAIEIKNQKLTKELMSKMRKMLEEQNFKSKLNVVEKKIDKKPKKIDKKHKQNRPKPKKQKPKKIIQKQTKEKQVIFNEEIVLKKKTKTDKLVKSNLSEINDYENSLKYTKKEKAVEKKSYKYKGKPKLAIIIDDVSFLNEVKHIKQIPFKVTPSFFPPTKFHPDTVNLSNQFKFAMVHLPLEAMGFMHPEPSTLHANDSKSVIKKRIMQIKKEFPKIKYYNNHTGSKFTSNLRAMQDLISIMKNEKLHFLDSRTTAQTKAGIVSKNLHVKLLSRDVFLDNIAEPKSIIKQLKKAVQIAKRKGYAIAIGHPHPNTLKTLIGAKKYLKSVKLVYINEL